MARICDRCGVKGDDREIATYNCEVGSFKELCRKCGTGYTQFWRDLQKQLDRVRSIEFAKWWDATKQEKP